MTREYTYPAVFEPAEEGGYIVSFPALPGCVTQGETLDEARAMAADALQGYLQVLVAPGRPVPSERPPPTPEGIGVMKRLMWAPGWATPKPMVAVLPRCRGSPFTSSHMSRRCGSGTS